MAYAALMEGMRKSYKILVGNDERKRPFGRHRHRWEYNIRMDVRGTGLEVWTVFL
jgi:hypothetical protein